MAEYKHDKLYFLKLPKGFFRRHDMLILEGMPNGKEYSLFYLKLMLESLDHDGYLRFNELIPYNEEMLASVTNTNVDIVRVAITVLTKMQLVEVLDDKTIYMRQVEKMTQKTTIGADKKQQQFSNREQTLQVKGGTKVENFPPEYRDKSKELRVKNKNKDICSEPSGFEPSDDSNFAEIPFITLTLNTKEEYPIYSKQVQTFKELYPNVDIEQQLRSMKGWITANPQKRKTKSGILRFVNSWLSAEQNKGKGGAVAQGTSNIFAQG